MNLTYTNNKRLYTIDNVKKVLDNKGYSFFGLENPFNVNIIGVRSFNTKANSFDDTLILIFSDYSGKNWNLQFDITTDPGLYYLNNPLNYKGTAILVPDQYRGVWEIRKHQGKYKALCEKSDKPVKVYRDNNRDAFLDFDRSTIEEGVFGINLHHSNYYTESFNVGKWSAGCQVFKRVKDFNYSMSIFREAKKIWGNSFTYTLLEEKDFILNY